MIYGKREISTSFINRVTIDNLHFAKEISDKCIKYDADSDYLVRMSEAVCKYCFYITTSRIGGCAMTSQPCGICEEVQMYGSTATNVLCQPCGVKHNLCVRCGADLLDRPKRKFKNEESNTKRKS